jgi:aldose 1-epimerase
MTHQIQKYTEDNFEIVELKNNFISARIAVNIGNTLFSINRGNQEKLYFPYSLNEYNTNTQLAGNPFMHPWANRLEGEYIQVENQQYLFPENNKYLLYRDGNNLPLHGLLLKSDKWETIELYKDEQTCYHLTAYKFDDEKLLSLFPFKHKILMKHQLKNNELTIETTIFNEDEKSMPITSGFHPYFLKTDENATLKIPADEVIEVNDNMIPTGNFFNKNKKWNFINDEISLKDNAFDDGFQGLKYNENQVSEFSSEDIKIAFDKNFAYAQVYAPSDTNKPYVCIEPMTAATNALNKNTCVFLQNKETFTASFTIII